jgi:hypothetical protein
MFENIDFTYFFISFCIGLFFVYLTKPKPHIINKFPSPDNLDTLYKDNSDNCYKYKIEKTDCSVDAIDQPIMEDFTKKKMT